MSLLRCFGKQESANARLDFALRVICWAEDIRDKKMAKAEQAGRTHQSEDRLCKQHYLMTPQCPLLKGHRTKAAGPMTLNSFTVPKKRESDEL